MTLSRRGRRTGARAASRRGPHVPRPTVQADGGEAGLGPVHLLRRADQHQDQRHRLAHLHPADGRGDRAPRRLRADDQGPGARVRERDGDEPLLPRPQRRQFPDQHLPPARHDLAVYPLRAQQRPAVRGPEAAAGAAQPGHGKARPGAHRRRDRLRQVDHPGGDDRLPQQQPLRPYPHARGSRSSTCSSTSSRSSTSARSASTPRTTTRRWATHCARPPT